MRTELPHDHRFPQIAPEREVLDQLREGQAVHLGIDAEIDEVDRRACDRRIWIADTCVAETCWVRSLRPKEADGNESGRVGSEDGRSHVIHVVHEVLVHHPTLGCWVSHVIGETIAGGDRARREAQWWCAAIEVRLFL